MLVLNLFGGPGSGKSTMAARVFSELKEKGYNAELVTEFAKDLTWEESHKVLDNQTYVFAKQYHRLWRLKGNVDIVVTDSPIIFSLIYGETSSLFRMFVVDEFKKFDNINVFLKRVKKYNPKGRTQTLEEAIKIDDRIKSMMCFIADTKFDLEVDGKKESTDDIVKLIEERYDRAKGNA